MQLPQLFALANFEKPETSENRSETIADMLDVRIGILMSAVLSLESAFKARTADEQARTRLKGTWAHENDFIGTVVGLESSHIKPETTVVSPEPVTQPPQENSVQPIDTGLDVDSIRRRIAGIADAQSVARSETFEAISPELVRDDLILG